MLLAELEVRHSRAVAPTRRVALGPLWLPTEPAPGFGGILLGGIVAAHLPGIEPDLRTEYVKLLGDLEAGRAVAQPRLRHRFQTDVVGLERSHHSLVGDGERPRYQIHRNDRPVAHLLAAAYAAGKLHSSARPSVFAAMRKAARWEGGIDDALVTHLRDPAAVPPSSWRQFPTDERWALQVLGFGPDSSPERTIVQARFRVLIRAAHPDHGADVEGAGQRILELTEARRILLA